MIISFYLKSTNTTIAIIYFKWEDEHIREGGDSIFYNNRDDDVVGHQAMGLDRGKIMKTTKKEKKWS